MITRIMLVLALVSAAVVPAAADTLRLWRDCSASMSETGLQQAAAVLMQQVERSATIDAIEIVRFSCKGERFDLVLPQVFPLPPKPAPTVARGGDGLVSLFSAAARAGQASGEKAYAKALAEWQASRLAVIEKAATALRQAPDAAADCTRFDQLAVRLVEEDPPISVVLTDGWIDCAQRAPGGLHAEGAVIVVLLPRNVDRSDQALAVFEKRKSDLGPFFPYAEFVRPYLAGRALGKIIR